MKKSNKIIGISILVTMLSLLVVVVIYAMNVDNTSQFHPNRTGLARILHERIMNMDLYGNYPKTPEEVMNMQADILMILYGDFILDETIFEDIIRQQRLLFSDELRELNSFDNQHSNFLRYLDILRDNGIRAVSTEVLPIEQSPMENFAIVRITQSFSNLGTVRWVYHLERISSSSSWRIARWTVADENFVPMW